jgi:hypothetical protein
MFNVGELVTITVLMKGMDVSSFGRVVEVIPNALCPYRITYNLGDGRGDRESDFPLSKVSEMRTARAAVMDAVGNGGESVEIAPDNCWLERAKCHGRENSYQVFYRSRQPIFNGRKRLYVGMDGSPAVASARSAVARRNALRGRLLRGAADEG